MPNQIKSFRSMQMHLKTAGFIADETNQQGYCTFNRKNLFHVYFLGLMFVFASAFFIFRANNVYEYGGAYTGANIAIIMLLYFAVFMCKTKDILLLIIQYDKFIERSKQIKCKCFSAKTVNDVKLENHHFIQFN